MAGRRKPTGLTATEFEEQSALVELVRMMPEFRDTFFSVPNGSYLAGDKVQRAMQMNRLKSEGLRVGVSDLVFPEPILFRQLEPGESLGLMIEMKRTAGGKVSTQQREWQKLMRERGYEAEIAHGLDDALDIVTGYGRRIRNIRGK